MPHLPESHMGLFEGPGPAALATIGPDGRPQVTAIGFILDDGVLRTSLNETRQKTRNLLARPPATLFFLDRANPLRTAEVRGDARLELDEDYTFADRVGAKYGFDLRTKDNPGERRYIVTIDPVRINTTTQG